MSRFEYRILVLCVAACFIMYSCEGKTHKPRHRRHRNETESVSKTAKKAAKASKCEFECADGSCIQTRFVCDGWKDCDNDESTCPDYRCRGVDFSKLTGFNCHPLSGDVSADDECIPYHMFCDGEVQCSNGNDELYCDYFGDNELYDILTTNP